MKAGDGVAEEAGIQIGGLLGGERRAEAGLHFAGAWGLGHDRERAFAGELGVGVRRVEDAIGVGHSMKFSRLAKLRGIRRLRSLSLS